ncbi:MAG: Sapep family Mn(2+)-dependent dipeptidase [Clostridia bacterium]|nr:Sapep family Mn(2+)-dependent dipeptidase [Clostridia bacterium]
MKEYSSAIHDYIQSNRQNIVSMLSHLVRIPSVYEEGKEGAIFGEACRDAVLHAEALYKEVGLDTFTNKDCAYTLGRTQGDDKVIGIFTHADVVSAVEEDWILTKPFEPIEKDGFLVGRGAEDNKSGIVSAIWAVKAMKHAGVMPKSTLLIYSGGNEEGGMCDLEYFEKEQTLPDVAIVPDNEYPVCRGEKGILRFWASFRTPFETVISINGGQALNIVLGSVRCEMKYSEALLKELHKACDGKSEYTLTAGDTIVLTAKGKSTHAAYSEGSVNALWVMIQALKTCKSLGNDLAILKNAEMLVADPFSETVGLGTSDTTFKKTTCTNGVVMVTDGCLKLSFDTRYGTEVDVDTFVRGYQGLLDKMDADCQVVERNDGYVIPENSPIIESMTQAWYSVTGDDSKPVVSYGGTYARHLKNAVSIGTFIPTTPKLDLPDGHGGIHQPDEVIDIDGLLKSIEVITHMILKADEALHA